jgi:adenine-specific DNA-methyltransferase
MMVTDLVLNSYELGRRILEKRPSQELRGHGQFLTPPAIARYMASQLSVIENGARVLEPAAGSGVLVCAVIERLISENRRIEFWVDAYEIDAELSELLRDVLTISSEKAGEKGIIIHWNVFQDDFILACLPDQQPRLFESPNGSNKEFDFVISNPPYFKLNADDKRVKAAAGKLNGHTNIYTLFMALSTKLLSKGGRGTFIVPRSFCSGNYFANFRRDLLKETTPLSVHLFQSRDDVFRSSDVLQENIIFTFEKSTELKTEKYWAGFVDISMSIDDRSLENNTQMSRRVTFRHFLGRHHDQYFFRLPTGSLDEQILDTVDCWDGSLERFGLQVSTGRVVPFRSRSHLRNDVAQESETVPLLWMQHVKPYQVRYPLPDFDKPQAITQTDDSLLIPNTNYVLLRRFSAKEDRRRLIAAPFIGEDFSFNQIGLENHLNFIYRRQGELKRDESVGLSAILNSALVDRYFRIVNGNTQVNAAELRVLPLPPLETIIKIGKRLRDVENLSAEVIDGLVFSTLWETKLLDDTFPLIQETRITMGKIEQAQEILEALGLPSAQQNEIAALTLLTLAQLSEDTSWKNATKKSLRIHDILVEIKQRYGREYAENTRETIRRQVLHQFEQGGLVLRNPDDPSLATNSPNTHYALSDLLIDVLRNYGTPAWEGKRDAFINQRGALLEMYQKAKDHHKVPLKIGEGKELRLSPGKHNHLQAIICSEFGPRFAPGAKLLYIGDTSNKILVFERQILTELGVPITEHDKLPDIVLYDKQRNWIFLIEAVTSHGPVSPKRYVELEAMFKNCIAGRIYVTAFLDFIAFKKFSNEIAWETEVWISELPSHLIHFNGDKFLGPR